MNMNYTVPDTKELLDKLMSDEDDRAYVTRLEYIFRESHTEGVIDISMADVPEYIQPDISAQIADMTSRDICLTNGRLEIQKTVWYGSDLSTMTVTIEFRFYK